MVETAFPSWDRSRSLRGVVLKVLTHQARVEVYIPRRSMYAIYAYIDPPNYPNVGIYGSPMERLGYISGLRSIQLDVFGAAPVVYNRCY